MAKLFNTEQDIGLIRADIGGSRGVAAIGAQTNFNQGLASLGSSIGQLGRTFGGNRRNQRREGKFIAVAMDALRGINNPNEFKLTRFNISRNAAKDLGSEGAQAVNRAIDGLTAPTLRINDRNELETTNFTGSTVTTPLADPQAESLQQAHLKQAATFDANLPNTAAAVNVIAQKVNAENQKKGLSTQFGQGPELGGITHSEDATLNSLITVGHLNRTFSRSRQLAKQGKAPFYGDAFKAAANKRIVAGIEEALLSFTNPELISALRNTPSVTEADLIGVANGYFNDLMVELNTASAGDNFGIDASAVNTLRQRFTEQFGALYSNIIKADRDRDKFEIQMAINRLSFSITSFKHETDLESGVTRSGAIADRMNNVNTIATTGQSLTALAKKATESGRFDLAGALGGVATQGQKFLTDAEAIENQAPRMEEAANEDLTRGGTNSPEVVIATGTAALNREAVEIMGTRNRSGVGRMSDEQLKARLPALVKMINNYRTQMVTAAEKVQAKAKNLDLSEQERAAILKVANDTIQGLDVYEEELNKLRKRLGVGNEVELDTIDAAVQALIRDPEAPVVSRGRRTQGRIRNEAISKTIEALTPDTSIPQTAPFVRGRSPGKGGR